jgi:hypothetical protein
VKRFSIPEGNPSAVHDRAEGKSYHLPNFEEAQSLLELLEMMHECCGKYFSTETSNTGESNHEKP